MHTEDYRDFYQGSCDIKTITHGKMHTFLRDNDIAVLMFYDPTLGTCKATMDMYQTAAQITNRPNTAFAAVNCGKDSELCIKEDAVWDLPKFKAYASGRKVGELEYFFTITAEHIARFVEELPVPKHASTPTAQRRFY